MKRIIGVTVGLLACAGLLLGAAATAQAAHSTYGCFNCHVPHQAVPVSATEYGVPLWSPAQSADGLGYTYVMYSSPTFDALSPEMSAQPDGASKLCLGCHDGSYDHVVTPSRIFKAGDLATSHPISFKYTTAMATGRPLRYPTESSGLGGTIAAILLDSEGKMQCTSCHDVHKQGKGEDLLRWDISGFAGEVKMCNTCHDK